MTKLSVIVPIYNRERQIHRCIRSILEQTYKDIEIILVNDGSTDKSLEVCSEYESKDDRIIVIDKENGGVSTARNAGIEVANGEFISFVDSDDYIDLNYAKILIKFQEKNNCDVVLFNKFGDGIQSNVPEIQGIADNQDDITVLVFELLMKKRLNSPWDKLYRKEIIKDNNIRFPEGVNLGEDTIFNYQYWSKIDSIGIINNELYHFIYDISSKSLSKSYFSNKYEMLKLQDDLLGNLISSGNLNFKNAYEPKENIRVSNILSCILDMYTNENNLSYSDIQDYIAGIMKNEKYFDVDIIQSRYLKTFANMMNHNKVSILYLRFLAFMRNLKRLSYSKRMID